jgi:CubicO group peptidase (beta-lactamase class C family)
LNQVYLSVYDDDNLWQVKSVSVFRNGEIIAESYLKDESDRTRPQAIWSCTKQVTALLIGTMWDRGKLYLTNRAEQIIPIPFIGHRDKEAITIDNLLQMKSGIAFDNDKHSDVFRKKITSNSVDFVLGLDLNHYPGTYFNYNDGDPQLLSAIIQELSNRKTFVYADQVLFSKIGMTNYMWEEYIDGITLGAFGILTTPRELAKIGQLVLNKGRWDSTQVVSEEWIEKMTTIKTSAPYLDNIDFGYYWWIQQPKG